jgi:hypothetical protein
MVFSKPQIAKMKGSRIPGPFDVAQGRELVERFEGSRENI